MPIFALAGEFEDSDEAQGSFPAAVDVVCFLQREPGLPQFTKVLSLPVFNPSESVHRPHMHHAIDTWMAQAGPAG